MEPNRTSTNPDEILQHIKRAAELPNLSLEKKAVLDKASKEVQEVLGTYFASIEKLSAESSLAPKTPEFKKYTLSDLEKIGINPGEHFQTPLEDGSSTVREVSFAGSGIVVLSNTDTTKYGILDEIYTPDQYHTLAEKVSTGVYTSATQDISPVETSVVIDTPPIESIPVVSNMATPLRRSLAELLGQGEPAPANTTTVPGIPTTETIPEKPNTKTGDTPNPTTSTPKSSLVEIPVSVETGPAQLLPVSPDNLIKIENSLKNDRPHQATYIFLAGALQKSWIKTIPNSEPIPVIPVSKQADVLPTPTSTGTAKLDAASMFNN